MPDLLDYFMTGRSVHAPKGEVILRGDDLDADIFYISKGFIKVYSINDDGEEYVHIIYRPGDVFPVIWALKNRRRRVFYETMSSAVLWKIPKNDFLKYIKENSDKVVFSVLEQLAEQFNVYADRLDNVQYKSAAERVAYRLLFLAGRFGQKKGTSVIIEAPITHKLIGQSINLSRESVSREIESLTKSGSIGIENGKIVIKDLKKLSSQISEPVTLDMWGLQ